MKPEYHPDEEIQATAEGNPPPQFEWHKLDGGGIDSVIGNRLTITTSMEGNNTYRCDATNTLVNGDVMKANTTITFSVTSKTNIYFFTLLLCSCIEIID